MGEDMQIHTAICNIMSEIGAIEKAKTNQQQGFKYRGIDDVMNALQPLFVKHRIYAVPEMLEHTREERQTKSGGTLIYSICKMKYTFHAEDDSSVFAVVIGEGMDSGDKATNKAMAIAMKYACFQVFCIPTEEMKDPDGESHELKGQEPKQEPKKQEPKKQEPKPEPKQEPKQETDIEKRARAIYYKMTGNKEGQYGWPLEEFRKWLKDFKEAGSISSDYSKNWTLEDVEFIEAQIQDIPF